MARLPFNPDRIPAPPRNGGEQRSEGGRPLTVSEVSELIRDALADALPGKVRIVGEISNFSSRSHWFFSLKDDRSCLRCVCFASAARRVGFAVNDGMEVVCTGRLDYYDAQGQLQLYVERLEPVGQGTLELRFRALCNELREKGYFDVERKKPLPVMPRRVAVVTSRSGAALQDVINTASRRWAGCELVLLDVRVQGAQCAPEVAAAIDRLSEQGPRLKIDAILLTRGGGSIEDLWGFNERLVADAIYRCRLPIVAAIGHETDTTVAELVADLRCATPTQAAMTLIPDRAALAQQVQQLRQRLALLTRRRLEQERQRLEVAARHAMFRRPEAMLAPVQQRLAHLQVRLGAGLPRLVESQRDRPAQLRQRLQQALPHLVQMKQQQLDAVSRQAAQMMPRRLQALGERMGALGRQLEAIGPRSVLRRGYSYTLTADGCVLRSASAVAPGDAITTVLADGRLTSVVQAPEVAAVAPVSQPGHLRKRVRRKLSVGDGDPGLFG